VIVEERLKAMRDLIQRDVNDRGLARDPKENLLTACAGDFAAACRSIAQTPNAVVGVVTGFYIPTAEPPGGETDGPLGAVFLARALQALGIRVFIETDQFCKTALEAGLTACGLNDTCRLCVFPENIDARDERIVFHCEKRFAGLGPQPVTHLIAVERVGPSHTVASVAAQDSKDVESLNRFIREVPVELRDRCRTMRGLDITSKMAPAHILFATAKEVPQPITTIGIGDGGNEIGIGKMPWEIIRRNIPNGGLIACRSSTDHLIVAGVSNWGAYALAAGVALLRGQQLPAEVFDVEREREILRVMVEKGPLVDGVTGRPSASVDGLSFDDYARPLRELAKLVEG
jgi:hypothetical protein